MAILELHYERWDANRSRSEFGDFLPAFLAGETAVSPFAAGFGDDE